MELAGLLIDKGADVSPRDKEGRTPLHFAAFYCGGPDAVERASCGAPIRIVDLYADIPKNAAEMVQLLIARGADVLSETNEGQTPAALATEFERPQIAAVLEAAQIAAELEAVRRRAQCEAFAMAQHERLGAGSGVPELEDGVVKMVLEYV